MYFCTVIFLSNIIKTYKLSVLLGNFTVVLSLLFHTVMEISVFINILAGFNCSQNSPKAHEAYSPLKKTVVLSYQYISLYKI